MIVQFIVDIGSTGVMTNSPYVFISLSRKLFYN